MMEFPAQSLSKVFLLHGNRKKQCFICGDVVGDRVAPSLVGALLGDFCGDVVGDSVAPLFIGAWVGAFRGDVVGVVVAVAGDLLGAI